jgi:hypothetical protein
MAQPNIPDEVRRLIVSHIPSVERLEILLLLFDGRKHAWTVQEIEEQIRSTPDSIRKSLGALVAAELAAPDAKVPAAVRYRGTSEELDAAVTELALVYRTRRVAVIELIYADRGPKTFSDAFKLGRSHDA